MQQQYPFKRKYKRGNKLLQILLGLCFVHFIFCYRYISSMNKTQKNLVQRRNTTIGVRFLFSVVLYRKKFKRFNINVWWDWSTKHKLSRLFQPRYFTFSCSSLLAAQNLRQASWMVRAAFISLQRRNPLVLFSIFQSKLAAFISIVNPDPELFDSDTDLARIKEKIN